MGKLEKKRKKSKGTVICGFLFLGSRHGAIWWVPILRNTPTDKFRHPTDKIFTFCTNRKGYGNRSAAAAKLKAKGGKVKCLTVTEIFAVALRYFNTALKKGLKPSVVSQLRELIDAQPGILDVIPADPTLVAATPAALAANVPPPPTAAAAFPPPSAAAASPLAVEVPAFVADREEEDDEEGVDFDALEAAAHLGDAHLDDEDDEDDEESEEEEEDERSPSGDEGESEGEGAGGGEIEMGRGKRAKL